MVPIHNRWAHLPFSTKSNANYFSAGEIFALDLGDSKIALTAKQEIEEKLLEKELKKMNKYTIKLIAITDSLRSTLPKLRSRQLYPLKLNR